jgi:hypothetical protein
MRQWSGFRGLVLTLSAMVAACDNGEHLLSLDGQSVGAENNTGDEAPYCIRDGGCLQSPAHRCCNPRNLIQIVHTTCSIGKCCRLQGSGCTADLNQCCYPYSCKQSVCK